MNSPRSWLGKAQSGPHRLLPLDPPQGVFPWFASHRARTFFARKAPVFLPRTGLQPWKRMFKLSAHKLIIHLILSAELMITCQEKNDRHSTPWDNVLTSSSQQVRVQQSVVMDRQKYINEVMRQVNNHTNYHLPDSDPTETFSQQIQHPLDDMHAREVLTDKAYGFISPTDCKPARFYHQSQLHKESIPGCPIVSGNGSPTENISLCW